MLLMGAPVSVDSFFLLSGLLVAWSMLKYLDHKYVPNHNHKTKILTKRYRYSPLPQLAKAE